MHSPRLIARMDIKNKNLIKPINLEGLRIVGDPNVYAKKYYANGIDEILFMDTVATLYSRSQITEIIKKITNDIFIPITVGGGIRSFDDVNELLNSGADKVAINTAAVENPKLIKNIADKIGSQSLIVSIDAKKRSEGKWEVYVNNGRDRTGLDVIEWIRQVVDMGAGEVLVTSIDREGTRKGFDYDLAKSSNMASSIPVIISGGCGELEHLNQLKFYSGIDAVAVADCIHYNKISIHDLKKTLITI